MCSKVKILTFIALNSVMPIYVLYIAYPRRTFSFNIGGVLDYDCEIRIYDFDEFLPYYSMSGMVYCTIYLLYITLHTHVTTFSFNTGGLLDTDCEIRISYFDESLPYYSMSDRTMHGLLY